MWSGSWSEVAGTPWSGCGMGLLAGVYHVCIGTPSCLVKALGPHLVSHLGLQLGGILHLHSLLLALAGVSHQRLGTSGPLHGMAGS